MTEKSICCGAVIVVFFVISFCAYVVAIGVGWSLARNVYPDDGWFTAAAVVTTIPMFAVIGYICSLVFIGCASDKTLVINCIGACAMITYFAAGILEFTGAILFIIDATNVKDDSTQAFTYGLVAGIFGLIASVSCSCSIIGYIVVFINT